MDTGSIFRVYVFKADSVGPTGLDFGYIRAKDNQGRAYDFKVINVSRLSEVDRALRDGDPTKYDIIVSSSSYGGALVSPDPETRELPPVGLSDVEDITCEILGRGTVTPPMIISAATAANNPDIGKNTPIAFDTTPGAPRSEGYDPEDKQARIQRAVSVAGMTVGPGGPAFGIGPHSMNISPNGGMNMSVENQTNSTQESDHAGGMMTTSLNFLQHYFIGLGNAVALPMPHMVNIIKMVAIGKFVKGIIGKKGKRVDAGNGTTKWQSGTGIFGLSDEIADIAK